MHPNRPNPPALPPRPSPPLPPPPPPPTPIVITPWDTHQPKTAGNTTLRSASYSISMSDHAGTHVNALKHFDPTTSALSIDDKPLETLYTKAICLDLSHIELYKTASVQDVQNAVSASRQEIRPGDTVLWYFGYSARVDRDWPRWKHDFPGLSIEGLHWLADQGIGILGVAVLDV
ncbi:putative cyclase-domain-containing protein [Clohesyomyces aquaticus]|uniref:Putative cyclase-domain-containing protein n=1 Tax=Clohesyomyces aquaticus TaxID=1231657 RepID=A0A1Y2AA18_9PLEO|nr:putative cyclase-domain-containing protein [Clohesyomyces aquaticus]